MRPWAAEASAGASGGPWGLQLKGGPEVTQGPSAGTCNPPLTTGDGPSGHPAAQLAAAVLSVAYRAGDAPGSLGGVSSAYVQLGNSPSPGRCPTPVPHPAVTLSPLALICGPQHQPSPQLCLPRPSSAAPSTSRPPGPHLRPPAPAVPPALICGPQHQLTRPRVSLVPSPHSCPVLPVPAPGSDCSVP